MNATRPLRSALGLALLLSLLWGAPLFAALPGDRVDLKVLVLSSDGTEPTFAAWTTALDRAGVPYDTLVAEQSAPITADTLAAGPNHARYQAVVLATGGLIKCGLTGCASALSQAEWDELNAFQVRYGVRRVVAYAYPTPEYGFMWPFAAGDQGSVVGTLTPAGQQVFTNLAGQVPVASGAYGYLAAPLLTNPAGTFETLVEGPVDSAGTPAALVGVHHRSDGFDELVLTIDANAYQLHSLLLAHGLIEWATAGVHLGLDRNYFTLHIDDVFLSDDRWDMNDNVTYEDDGATNPTVRMTAADVDRALAWQSATGLKLDLVFNGAGSDEAIAAQGSDPLTAALSLHRAQFRWINHTYTHLNLDSASAIDITAEIVNNVLFASKLDLTVNCTSLVTGEHSGLHNPSLPAALLAAGIVTLASDNSREPLPYAVGQATTIPRHPSNVYYNVGTFEEQLDEYNYVYFDGCVASPVTTCLTAPATYAQYVDSEATIMLRHLLTNDPRPHYFHQNNLAEDGTLYPVVNEVLARYNAYVTAPLLQPTFANSSQILARQLAWAALRATPGAVEAYLKDGVITLIGAGTVPVSGYGAGAMYGAERSGWVTVDGVATLPLEVAAGGATWVEDSAVVTDPCSGGGDQASDPDDGDSGDGGDGGDGGDSGDNGDGGDDGDDDSDSSDSDSASKSQSKSASKSQSKSASKSQSKSASKSQSKSASKSKPSKKWSAKAKCYAKALKAKKRQKALKTKKKAKKWATKNKNKTTSWRGRRW